MTFTHPRDQLLPTTANNNLLLPPRFRRTFSERAVVSDIEMDKKQSNSPSDNDSVLLGSVFAQERRRQKLTQEYVSEKSKELKRDKIINFDFDTSGICNFEKGKHSRFSEERAHALCQVLGSTRNAFVQVANHEKFVHQAMNSLLKKCTAAGIEVTFVISAVFKQTSDGSMCEEQCSKWLIKDMRCEEYPTTYAQRVILRLVPTLNEQQLKLVTELTGLLASAAVRPLPSVDGSGTIDIINIQAGWVPQIIVDGNNNRPAGLLLEWNEARGEYPEPIDPVHTMQVPRSAGVKPELTARGAVISELNKRLGFFGGEELPNAADDAETYQIALDNMIDTLKPIIHTFSTEPNHVLLYSTQPCPELLAAVKNSLPPIRAFDLYAKEGREALHCEEKYLRSFLRVCFKALEDRLKELEIKDNADNQRKARLLLTTIRIDSLGQLNVVERGQQTIVQNRKLDRFDEADSQS